MAMMRSFVVALLVSSVLGFKSLEPGDSSIYAAPKLVPNYDYKKHLEEVYQEANPDAISHQEKLQLQNRKLRRTVKDLEAELGDGVTRERSDELGAIVATSAEFEQDRAKSVGTISTLLILGTIMTGALITGMAQNKDNTVKATTWSALEKVLIIFVAVMWFQVFDDFFDWAGASLHMEVLASSIHCAVVLLVILGVAGALMKRSQTQEANKLTRASKQTMQLVGVVIAWGMHYLSFMLVHAGGHAQDAYFSQSIWLSVLCIFVCFFVFAGFSALTRHLLIKQYANEDDAHYIDNVEELEDDVSGMMLAYVSTMLVRFIICGSHQPLTSGETGETLQHTAWQRCTLLIYAVVVTVLALILQSRLSIIGEHLENTMGGYIGQRIILLLSPFLVMLAAWAFVMWADWEFYEHLFRGEMVLGRVAWSTVCTIVSFALIFLLAKINKRVMHPDRRDPDRLRRQSSKAMDLAWRWNDLERRKYIITAIAVMVGFSWAQSLSVSIDATAERRAHPIFIKFFLKAMLTMVLTVVAFPAHFYYFRNIVGEMESAEDKDLELHK